MKQFKFLGLGRGTLGIHFYHDEFCILEVFMFHGFFCCTAFYVFWFPKCTEFFGGGEFEGIFKAGLFFSSGLLKR